MNIPQNFTSEDELRKYAREVALTAKQWQSFVVPPIYGVDYRTCVMIFIEEFNKVREAITPQAINPFDTFDSDWASNHRAIHQRFQYLRGRTARARGW